MVSLSSDQRDELHDFIKDWLRHAGRTQADLRRALKAASVRMPVLLDQLEQTYREGGLGQLVQQLCAIEADWHSENQLSATQQTAQESTGLSGSLLQLDLLLQEIRQDQEGQP